MSVYHTVMACLYVKRTLPIVFLLHTTGTFLDKFAHPLSLRVSYPDIFLVLHTKAEAFAAFTNVFKAAKKPRRYVV